MDNRRELLVGVITAIITIIIIIGGLAYALAEENLPFISRNISIQTEQIPPTATSTPQPAQATTTPTLMTPSFTPTDISLPTDTPIPSDTPTPSPTMTISPTCTIRTDWVQKEVKTNDTIESLATLYGITVEEIILANCLLSAELTEGMLIYLPQSTVTPTQSICQPPEGWIIYRVKRGDTLFGISQTYNITVIELQSANCLGSSTLLIVGRPLYVPNIATRTLTFTITPSPTDEITITNTNTPTESNTPQPTATPGPSATPIPIFTLPPSPIPTGEG